jgi:two-component system response regulator AtoC
VSIESSPPETQRFAGAPKQEAPPSRFSLLVMSEAGVFTYALPDSGEVTVGRGDGCIIRIADAKASRIHVILRIGETVQIVDQASTNGTRVGDRSLAPRAAEPLAVGDVITIGSTVLTLKPVRAWRAPARVYSEPAFREHAERELGRAATGEGGLAIVQIRLQDHAHVLQETMRPTAGLSRETAMVERLEAALAEVLRPADVVATYSPGAYVVLVSQVSAEVATTLGAQLRTELRALKIPALVGLACHPRDGATLDALASAALDEMTEQRSAPPAQLDQGAMKRVAPIIDRIAAGHISVLILGETGVGKEVMARTLHVRSERALGPLVCVNCASLSESLLESELFGHEKGAFTGALQAKAGLLESANGGTVFLDEIGEMPLSLQAKMLRVLEAREVLRVGAVRPRAIDVRFLSATNRDLETEIKRGRFRQDLFFRLNGISLTIPPLRERVEEIEGLAAAFAQQAAQIARRDALVITRPVLALLKRYPWPGNIRELRNVIERAVILSSGKAITLDHMPAELMGPVVAVAEALSAPPRAPLLTTPQDPDGTQEMTLPLREGTFRPGMSDRERVIAALEACAGNQTHAARLLGIARRTLIMRIEEYALPRPRKK